MIFAKNTLNNTDVAIYGDYGDYGDYRDLENLYEALLLVTNK
jgi:hypothetical protein